MAALSQHAFALLAGVSQPSVKQAAREGRLIAVAGGGLDPAHPVNAAFLASHAPDAVGTGASGVAAKVAALAAKARLLRQRLDEQEASLVERDVYLRASLDHVPAVRSWLAGIPERRAEELAVALGCSAETARGVLTELVLQIAGELGDIGADVTVAILAA